MAVSEQTVISGKQLDELCVNTIRTLSIDAVQQANSGHPGAPMGLAPVAIRCGSSSWVTTPKILPG